MEPTPWSTRASVVSMDSPRVRCADSAPLIWLDDVAKWLRTTASRRTMLSLARWAPNTAADTTAANDAPTMLKTVPTRPTQVFWRESASPRAVTTIPTTAVNDSNGCAVRNLRKLTTTALSRDDERGLVDRILTRLGHACGETPRSEDGPEAACCVTPTRSAFSLEPFALSWFATAPPCGSTKSRTAAEPSWGAWRLLALENQGRSSCRQIAQLGSRRPGATRLRRSRRP